MKGNIPSDVLEAMLETIPIEFSILDKNDKVLVWNKHETRLFKRSEKVLGRDVRKCHPNKSLDKVEQIIQEMKDNIRNKARFWIDLKINDNVEKILIEYYALRNPKGEYLGCMESSQVITEIMGLKGEKRLLE
ncbi:MAG: PAS domain-containing protein [Candidatus Hermodarchaeota archaeon]